MYPYRLYGFWGPISERIVLASPGPRSFRSDKMATIMSNPLQSCAATIKNMQEQRESCTAEIAALEEEKTVIHQAMGVVFDRLGLQNDKLGRLIQERNAFDRAIGEMSQAFEQIVSTSKTLVNVAHREQEGIAPSALIGHQAL